MIKRFAAVDVGSNTIKVTIADYFGENRFQNFLYKDFPSCLGHNLVNNIINPSALRACYVDLKKIDSIIRENKVDAYKYIATHALRVATNQGVVKNLIKENTGIDINIISGEEEARLSLLAVMMDYKDQKSFACINAGGGSTELGFHFSDGDKLVVFEFGAVNLHKDLIRDSKDIDAAIYDIRRLVTREFNQKVNFPFTDIENVYSMGGSIFNAGYLYKKDSKKSFQQLFNLRIPINDLLSIINELKSAGDKEKKLIPGMDVKRLESTLPGILIHYTLLLLLQKNELFISIRSISDGLIYEMAQ